MMMLIANLDAALADSWRQIDRRIAIGMSDAALMRRETAEALAKCARLEKQIADLIRKNPA